MRRTFEQRAIHTPDSARAWPVLLLLLAWPFQVSAATDMNRRVAVTFDDLPVAGAAEKSDAAQQRLTKNLIHAISTRELPVTGFVNEGKMYENGIASPTQIALLRSWIDADLDLGNHSYSHHDLNVTPLAEFQADVLRGDVITTALLEPFGKSPRYFRHPYLRTGTELKKRNAFEAFLAKHDYKVAPVSIDNSEWIFAWAYDLALQDGNKNLANTIGKEYVTYMLEIVSYYEAQSLQLFGRNIDHVLLVHANTLNSEWFGQMSERMVENGYEFISLDEALKDTAYNSPDNYVGQGGITWLNRWATTRGVDPKMFRGEPKTPNFILKLTGLPEHSDATQ